MALTDNLLGYWPVDEIDGQRKDIYNSNHLTDVNGTKHIPGKVGWAGQFTLSASNFLYADHGSALDIEAKSFSVVAWVYLDHITVNLTRSIITKWQQIGNYRGFDLHRHTSGWRMFLPTGSVTAGTASSVGWFFVVSRYNNSASTIDISINNSSASSATTTGAIAGSAQLKVGAIGNIGGSTAQLFMAGRIGPVALWSRVITDAEVSQLYNNGDGFDFLANNPRLRILADWSPVPDLAIFTKSYSISRGRSSDLDRVGAGTATIVVDDSTKTFLPLNTSGSLSGSLLPGRTIRIQWDYSGSTIKRFTGKTISYTPEPTIAGQRDTTIVCADEIEAFQRRETRSTLYTNIYSGCLIGSILDNAQFASASRALDTGQDLYEYAHFDRRKVDEVLVDIVQTEYGNAYIRGDGYYVFHDRYYRSRTTSSASFNEGMAGVTFRRDANDLKTEARVSITPKIVKPEQTVWTLQSPITISASSTASFFGNYIDSATCQLCPAGGIASPGIGVNALLNANASGTGTNLSASLTACLFAFAESFKAVASNGGAQAGYLVAFTITGCPIISYEQLSRTAIDTTACGLYGTRTLTYDAPLLGDADKAQQFAQFLVNRYSNPANVDKVTMTLINDNATHWEQILRRELDDRISVTASAVAISQEDFYIGNLSESFEAATGVHETTYTLEKTGVGDAFFLVDYDVVGGTRGLGY